MITTKTMKTLYFVFVLQTYNQSQSNKKNIYKAISGNRQVLRLYQGSPRMVPDKINPELHKMYITHGVYEPEKARSVQRRPFSSRGGEWNVYTWHILHSVLFWVCPGFVLQFKGLSFPFVHLLSQGFLGPGLPAAQALFCSHKVLPWTEQAGASDKLRSLPFDFVSFLILSFSHCRKPSWLLQCLPCSLCTFLLLAGILNMLVYNTASCSWVLYMLHPTMVTVRDSFLKSTESHNICGVTLVDLHVCDQRNNSVF